MYLSMYIYIYLCIYLCTIIFIVIVDDEISAVRERKAKKNNKEKKERNKGGNGQGVRERESCRLRGGVVRVRLWLKPWESGRGERGRRRGRARQRIPAAFKWSSHWEVLRFKMVSCDVDCVFDLSFEGFVLFSGGENLARSHFRTTNSQQKVGKPKQGDCKDRFFSPSS